MENKTRRGYDLPLTIQKWHDRMPLAVMVLFTAWMGYDMAVSDSDLVLRLTVSAVLFLFLCGALIAAGRSLAKLHLVPEGMAVTLFGRTVQRFPQEELHLLAGIHYQYKSYDMKWIVASAHTVEELAEIQAMKTPKVFQNARTRPDWAEDMAGKYLYRYIRSVSQAFAIPRRDLLLLEWSPERLELLLEMYPGVPWVDLSEKKKLDAERNM